MSRIGKQPIEIPKDVNIRINNLDVMVKGPKGELSWTAPDRIRVKVEGNNILLERTDDSKVDRALHGLSRSLLNNMVIGVTAGYQKVLEITGTGFRASVQGGKVTFTLGYSHPVEFQLPEGIKAAVDQKQTQLTLTGIDKQLLGQVAADIKSLRKPDIYKGKGIKFAGQRIKLKVGKAGKK